MEPVRRPDAEEREEWGTRHLNIESQQRIIDTFPDRDAALRHFEYLDEVWGHHAELIHRTVITTAWEPAAPAPEPSIRAMAEDLIFEAVREIPHERIRVMVSGLNAHPSDEQWRRINDLEKLVRDATVSVEFPQERS